MMTPVEGRNVRKYTIFSTVLAVLFVLKIVLFRNLVIIFMPFCWRL